MSSRNVTARGDGEPADFCWQLYRVAASAVPHSRIDGDWKDSGSATPRTSTAGDAASARTCLNAIAVGDELELAGVPAAAALGLAQVVTFPVGERLARGSPSDEIQPPNAFVGDENAFRHQQRPFQSFAATVSPKPAAGRDHAVARHVRTPALAQDVADGARRARSPGASRDVTVGGHATDGDPLDDGKNAIGEYGHLIIWSFY